MKEKKEISIVFCERVTAGVVNDLRAEYELDLDPREFSEIAAEIYRQAVSARVREYRRI